MFGDDFRSRQALADLERAAGGDPLGGDSSAAFDSEDPPDRLWSAAACLVWQALAGRAKDPFLEDIWDQRHADLIAAPSPMRAALMQGFDWLRDLGLTRCKPRPEDLVTVARPGLEAALMAIVQEMTEDEIDHVSRNDYGMDVARHRAALVALLADPKVAYPPGKYWYPAEVVELVAQVPQATGYIPCLAIVLLDALRTGDRHGNAAFRLQQHWKALPALPQRARTAVFAAYRHLYETDALSSDHVPDAVVLPWVEDVSPSPAPRDRK
jgi:hypothetical protein